MVERQECDCTVMDSWLHLYYHLTITFSMSAQEHKTFQFFGITLVIFMLIDCTISLKKKKKLNDEPFVILI